MKEQAQTVLNEWGLTSDGNSFETHSSLLWPVRDEQNQFMLKVAKPDSDEKDSCDVLGLYNGEGAVRVLRQCSTSFLLERLSEETLKEIAINGQDDDATQLVCHVAMKLHGQVKSINRPKFALPFEGRLLSMQKYLNEGRVDKKYLKRFDAVLDLNKKLIEDKPEDWCLLHGDLHHENVLNSIRGWLAIDPKGIWGPLAYEFSPMLCNPHPHREISANLAQVKNRLSIIQKHTSIQKELLAQHAYVHSHQVAAWSLDKKWQLYWLDVGETYKEYLNIS